MVDATGVDLKGLAQVVRQALQPVREGAILRTEASIPRVPIEEIIAEDAALWPMPWVERQQLSPASTKANYETMVSEITAPLATAFPELVRLVEALGVAAPNTVTIGALREARVLETWFGEHEQPGSTSRSRIRNLVSE